MHTLDDVCGGYLVHAHESLPVVQHPSKPIKNHHFSSYVLGFHDGATIDQTRTRHPQFPWIGLTTKAVDSRTQLPVDKFAIVLQVIITMKAVQVLLLAVVVACASAFSPVKTARPAFKSLSMSNMPEPVPEMKEKNAAALAAFATAMAPFAAHADTVDEATVIGYGAGLVACVVSLAVGFAIGYGTLVKL